MTKSEITSIERSSVSHDGLWYVRTGLTYAVAPFVGAVACALIALVMAHPGGAAATVLVAVGLSAPVYAVGRRHRQEQMARRPASS